MIGWCITYVFTATLIQKTWVLPVNIDPTAPMNIDQMVLRTTAEPCRCESWSSYKSSSCLPFKACYPDKGWDEIEGDR